MPEVAEKPKTEKQRYQHGDLLNDSGQVVDKKGRTAAERQMTRNKKAELPPLRAFRVSKTTPDGPVTAVVKARDALEAWAVFCDEQRSWPSRHAVEAQVELVD